MLKRQDFPGKFSYEGKLKSPQSIVGFLLKNMRSFHFFFHLSLLISIFIFVDFYSIEIINKKKKKITN